MKIKESNNKTTKKVIINIIIILTSLALVLLILGLVGTINLTGLFNNKATGQVETNKTKTQTEKKINPINNNVDSSKTTEEIPVAKDTGIEIARLDQGTNSVTYSATITNPGASGACSAQYTNQNNRPVTLPVIASEGNTCGPASISNASFTSTGEWTLTLRYYTDNTQAIATKTIEIK